MRPVTLGHLADRQRPADGEARVAGVQAAFRFWTVGCGVQINQLAIIGQRLEAVGKTFRNQQAPVIFRRKHRAEPVQERRRAAPQVQCHIKNFPAQTADNFDFRMGGTLKMHPPHRAGTPGQGMVDLDDWLVQPQRGKLPGTVEAGEEAAGVLGQLALDDRDASQGRWSKIEARQPSLPASSADNGQFARGSRPASRRRAARPRATQ